MKHRPRKMYNDVIWIDRHYFCYIRADLKHGKVPLKRLPSYMRKAYCKAINEALFITPMMATEDDYVLLRPYSLN